MLGVNLGGNVWDKYLGGKYEGKWGGEPQTMGGNLGGKKWGVKL